MSTKTCWRGHIYQGWSCPTCDMIKASERHAREVGESNLEAAQQAAEVAERTAREHREALEEHAQHIEELQREQQEEHRYLVEHADEIKAEALVDKAARLLRVGLLKEACDVAIGALRLDPECLPAYHVAVAAFRAQGMAAQARELLRKQISLLADPANAMNPEAHVELLESVGTDAELLPLLLNVLAANCNQYCDRWSLGGLNRLSRVLLGRGLRNQAEMLVEARLAKGETLTLHALRMELCGASSDPVQGYIARFLADSRETLLKQFHALNDAELALSSEVRGSIQAALRERYDKWLPDIRKVFAESARRQASVEARQSNGPAAAGCAVVALGIFVVTPVIISAFAYVLRRVLGDSMWLMIPYLLLWVGVWFAVRGFIRRSIEQGDYGQKFGEAMRNEMESWRTVNAR